MPLELEVELQPRARLDVLDVKEQVRARFGDVLAAFPKTLYCSLHTTAGYIDHSLATRLTRASGVASYIELFRTLFPENVGYRHDELELRNELTHAQRLVEPRNADSHLAFLAAGLTPCVAYRTTTPVYFIDLDGAHPSGARRRQTRVIGFQEETEVARVRLEIPVSAHAVDSISLKDPRFGLYAQLTEAIARHGVTKGRVRLELTPGEHHAGLTVNEYETLLMQHDLVEVLRNPVKFAFEKARNAWADPGTVPSKTLDYVKYDLVNAFNRVIDGLGLSESLVERLASRALALPAARFLRMKRSVNLLVSDCRTPGAGTIVEGTYQTPIPVQWRASQRRRRSIDAVITRLE